MQEGPPLGLDPLFINYQLHLDISHCSSYICWWLSQSQLLVVLHNPVLRILYLLAHVSASFAPPGSRMRHSLQESSTEDEFVLAWERCSNKVHVNKAMGLCHTTENRQSKG